MEVRSNLIYDIGAAFGDDSAYYLHKGYRVLAVEANPLAISHLKERFETEIRQDRLTVLPLAISEEEGEALFWVCDDDPNISSFDRSLAAHNGARNHSIVVQTCRFRTLLDTFGTPFFCKIDIEGSDTNCLRDLTLDSRPPYISAELTPGDDHIERLSNLGYARFKILSQRTFLPPNRATVALKARMPRRLSRRITKIQERCTRHHLDGAWRFSQYSSGPFGRGTRGRWQTAAETLALQQLIERNPDGSDWYDVHAALEPEDASF